MPQNNFTGRELLKFWEASDLSQRELARSLNLGFNSLHGKIYRAQQEQKEAVLQKTVEYPRVSLGSAVFDIETTSFGAGGIQDHLICTSILPLGGEVYTIAIDFEDHRDDSRVLQQTVDELCKYDILIGHNIIAFDLNWLNSRIMYHNLPPFPKRFLYYDTYQAAKRMAIKAERKSLAMLADFFRLPNLKTAIYPVEHKMIDSHHRDEFDMALEGIVDHCERDVLQNKWLFDAMWPRDKAMLNLPVTKKF